MWRETERDKKVDQCEKETQRQTFKQANEAKQKIFFFIDFESI